MDKHQKEQVAEWIHQRVVELTGTDKDPYVTALNEARLLGWVIGTDFHLPYVPESNNVPAELSLIPDLPSDINPTVGQEQLKQAIIWHCKHSYDQLKAVLTPAEFESVFSTK